MFTDLWINVLYEILIGKLQLNENEIECLISILFYFIL
jgi:hypothetical protein